MYLYIIYIYMYTFIDQNVRHEKIIDHCHWVCYATPNLTVSTGLARPGARVSLVKSTWECQGGSPGWESGGLRWLSPFSQKSSGINSSFSALKVMIMTPPPEKKRDKPQSQACVFICFYQGKKTQGMKPGNCTLVEISTVNAWDYKLLF